MARKIIKMGSWYIAYEIGSTALLMSFAANGFRVPGL